MLPPDGERQRQPQRQRKEPPHWEFKDNDGFHFSESLWKYFVMRPRYAGGSRVGSMLVTSGLSSLFDIWSAVSTEKCCSSLIRLFRSSASSGFSSLSIWSSFSRIRVPRSLSPYNARMPFFRFPSASRPCLPCFSGVICRLSSSCLSRLSSSDMPWLKLSC